MPQTPVILFEDNHIIVCVKPAGIASQSARSFQPDMTDLLRTHIAAGTCKGNIPYIGVVHRLDQPVGGVMVYAKDPAAAAALSRQTAARTMSKNYYAVLCGAMTPTEGTLTDYLLKDGRTNTSAVVLPPTAPGGDIKKASLSYRITDVRTIDGGTFSLADVALDTGRHHQIRVQFSHAGFPIFGDSKYNTSYPGNNGCSALGLFAYSLSFKHPVTHRLMDFKFLPRYEPFTWFGL